MRLDVIDLSHHNATPDFVKCKADGLVGVILKCTEGTSFTDKTFQTRRELAQNAGLVVSSYHFLRHNSVAAQMSHYLEHVEPVQGERVCIDYEHADCRLGDLTTAISAIRTKRPDLQITVYAGALLKEQLGNQRNEALAETSLWIAQYNNVAPVWPKATWPVYSLWQYSDGKSGGRPRHMDGLVGETDCNQFNGSQANCAIWLAPAKPAVPVLPELPAISIDNVAEMLADHEIRLRKLEGK